MGRSLRPFASHLITAPAFAAPFVAPFGDEASGVVVRATLPLIVNHAAISERQPVVLIHGRQVLEGQLMHQHGRGVHRVVRASVHIDEPEAKDCLSHVQRAGGIGIRAHESALGRAGAHGDRRRRVAANSCG